MTQATQPLAGQKVLITGAAGFLGSHLCRALVREGADVCAVSRRNPPSGLTLAEFRKADLSDLAAADQLMRGVRPQVVFHLAGHGVGSPELNNVLPTFRDDLMSAVNILTLATQLECSRVVLAASLEEPISASGELTPSSPYAAAKWACGAYARMFHKLYKAPAVIARPFMTYGPGQKAHKLIPYTILSLLQGKSPQLSSGKREVDWVFVEDVTEGLLAAGIEPGVEGCSIDLGSGKLVPIREVVQGIAELTGTSVTPQFGAISDRPVEQVRVANTAYAWEKLRWRAKTSLREGLQKTIEWYRQSMTSTAIATPLAHG